MVRPIVVVTGANGGVGFGICHRMLLQLSHPQPSDAKPVYADEQEVNGSILLSPSEGVTIIMACRDLKRAEDARSQLHNLLENHIAKLPRETLEYTYATTFQQNVSLDIHHVDLGVVRSVFRFSREISRRYPYISHIICNAGLSTYSHLDFGMFFRQCFRSPLIAVQHPLFNVQKAGVMSKDNLGFVWQCNVFGHYVLYRTLQPMLSRYVSQNSLMELVPRVLWMSSVDALPTYDPQQDWQLTKTMTSYQASKAQIDLIVMELAKRNQEIPIGESSNAVAHFLVSPGITATRMAAELLKYYVLELCMLLFLYFCRMLGSRHVSFSTYKAAIATTHVALMTILSPPAWHRRSKGPSSDLDASRELAAFPKYTVLSDRSGREEVGIEYVTTWAEHPNEGFLLVERCERLFRTFSEREEWGTDSL